MAEETLMLVKPDGVALGHVGEIITRLERRGFTLEALRVVKQATKADLADHYAGQTERDYYPSLVAYMQSGPLIALVVSGENVLKTVRRMAGATNPDDAAFGTIRGDFGRDWSDGVLRNIVHSSDSLESAQREQAIWFKKH